MIAKGYVLITPKWRKMTHYKGPFNGMPVLDGAVVSKVFVKRPPKSSVPAGAVVVEVEFDIPDEVFYDRRVQVTVQVPTIAAPASATATPVTMPVNPHGKALKRP